MRCRVGTVRCWFITRGRWIAIVGIGIRIPGVIRVPPPRKSERREVKTDKETVPEEEIISITKKSDTSIMKKSAIAIKTVMKGGEIPVSTKMTKSMAAERMRRKSVTSESSPTAMH